MSPIRFQSLESSNPQDREAWLRLWQRWPGREVSAHPAYVEALCADGERAICLAAETERGGVLFPLVLRSLGHEAWANAYETALDATTPYGYGGPFTWGEVDSAQFWEDVAVWAGSSRVVSCFVRLSLFPEQHLALPGEVRDTLPNIVRSLDLDSAAIWMDYEHKVRKNVSRAIRAGVTVETDLDGARLDDFFAIYNSTMERRDAQEYYYFPREFFHGLAVNLPGSIAFFHALLGGRIVSTELVLVSADRTYSFLGGTLADAFAVRPNDLLKHRIIEWSREQGKRAFVLGGGYGGAEGGADGIFRYKRSFAPSGLVQFRTGRIAFDAQEYRRLIQERRQFEAREGRSWEPQEGFFPAYRSTPAARVSADSAGDSQDG